MAIKIAVDFGSNYITAFNKGVGIVLKEPSIIIVYKYRKKLELIATGTKAIKMLNSLDKDMNVVYPINQGSVINYDACTLMIENYLKKISSTGIIKHRLEILVAISCGLTVAERRDIENVFIKAGAAQVTLIESPIAIFQQGNKDNALVMIIGGDLTEIAIVSDDGIINGCSVDIAGEAFNKAIIDYISIKYRLLIGAYAAEKIKSSIGSMYENDMSTLEINGKDIIENAPKSIEITASDVRKALVPLLDKLVEAIDSIMCSCPDNIIDEVYRNGIYLAGGSALIPGLGEYLGSRCKMTSIILNDPINAVACGGGSLLNDVNTLNRILSIEKD